LGPIFVGQAVDERDPSPPVKLPEFARIPVKLPGLPYLLHSRQITRQQVARELGVDSRRIYSLNSVKVRAEPWEIDKLKALLQVTFEQLTTVPPDAPVLPIRRRVPRPSVSPVMSDEETIAMPTQTQNEHPEETAALPVIIPADVTLSITLPDGRRYSVTSGQSASPEMLARMAEALLLLVNG
jgi:hypothetical protein